MEFKIQNKDIEYTTKEMLVYFLKAYKNAKQNNNNPILNDYIRGIIMAVENSNKKEILKDVETNLIAKFPFAHILNNEELMSYGLLVFYMLLKSNKEITEKDIVEQTEVEMKLYSARTIIEEADSLLDKLKK